MNLLRRTATTLGGIFFALLLIAALAPKATRAVAAALVQVTNTSANPVPTVSADSPGTFPFAAPICFSSGDDCSLISFTVPTTTSTGLPVKRLVIENLSGLCTLTSGVSEFTLFLETPVAGSTTMLFPFPLIPASPNNSPQRFVVAGSNVRIYSDPGDTVFVVANAVVPAGGFEFCNLVVEGHLETK